MSSQRVHCNAAAGCHACPHDTGITHGNACALEYTRRMLSEKQFRERARCELREIRNQVLSMARDRDVYWKVEREVIEPNPQLHGVRNAFLDMVRAAYADAMAARVLQLLDAENTELSLRRVLAQLEDYPHLLHDKLTEREFAADRAELDLAA